MTTVVTPPVASKNDFIQTVAIVATITASLLTAVYMFHQIKLTKIRLAKMQQEHDELLAAHT